MPKQSWGEKVFINFADGAAVTNTTTETVLISDMPIPVDWMEFKHTLLIIARGKISNVVTTPGTVTFRLRWNGVAGTIIAQSAALQMSATAFTNAIWALYAEMQVRAEGASGSVQGLGEVCAGNLSAVAPNYMGSAGATAPAPVTVDLTGSKTLSLTAQFSVANAANSITAMEVVLLSLN